MKLLGTRLEDDIRKQLIRSYSAMFLEGESQSLLESIKRSFPGMRSAFVINWIPEQGEDIYSVLVNEDTVAIFEIIRYSGEMISNAKKYNVKEYQRGLKRRGRVKLTIALELASKYADKAPII